MQAGAKHGRGQFIWSTLCRYEGEFDSASGLWPLASLALLHGFFFPQPKTEDNNDMHGEGVYTWSDGRGYSGG